ncbi:hypothetical protein ACMFN1_001623, partial [Campylobacter jejuni]|nr:hypothetical protein [Campylobacter jejuni]
MTLTIKEGGTLGPTNYSSSKTIYAFKLGQNGTNATLTLINQGTIQGKIGVEEWNNGSSTITVKTFENKKNIDGHIYMGGYGTISIENFTNDGTITMTNTDEDKVIYFENSQNNGNKGNIHIKTFHNKNTGTIESKNNKNSIALHGLNSTTPTLENFINEGTIKGKIGIENKNGNFTGTITVKTFENKKTIDGDIYMGLWGGSGTISIENFNNAGTISGISRNEKGVHFEGKNNAKVYIKTFHNQQNGTIESKDRQGVYF